MISLSRNLCILFLVIFMGLSLTFWVLSGASQAFDSRFLEVLRQKSTFEQSSLFWWFPVMVQDFTQLGSMTVLVFIVIVVCLGMWMAGQGRNASYFLFYVAGGFIANILMKHIFARPRPDVIEHLSTVYTSSFPSSHAMLSTVVYLGVGKMLSSLPLAAGYKRYAFGVSVFIVLMIGVSRLYLGVHYPTDVVAGWIFGFLWFALIWIYVFEKRMQGSDRLSGCHR